MKTQLAILTVILNTACGQMTNDKSQIDCAKDSSKAECPKEKLGLISVTGSVSGAFDVSVDGEHYRDIEAYYTAEVDRLAKRIADAGYKGYDAEFDAKLGFKDLTQGMTVFLAASDGHGAAGRAYLGSDDTFFFRLPSDTSDGQYRLKAVKRISIKLTKDSEVKRFCFNFAASAEVEIVDRKSEPVILSTFESSLTKYECSQISDEGLSIPKAEASKSKTTKTH